MGERHDVSIVRELAAQVAEIAALPVQDEKRALWRKLNALKPDRPMVMIDQVCWNEMNLDDELTLRCQDPECRQYEDHLRRLLYQWRHFPVDRVVESFIRVPRAIGHSGHGVAVKETIAVSDPTSGIVGHHFFNQFETDADLDKIQAPVVTHDPAETARRLEMAHGLFDGILGIVEEGYDPSYMTVWDPISFWMGVEGALYALIDRPDYMAELVRRVVAGNLSLLDQLEAQGLLCHPQPLVHCTGAWTDELPGPGFDPTRPRTRDLWMFSMAQMFSTVSPAMFEEFEIDPCLPIYRRFGCVYYGCCEPLDRKMAQVRKIPNVRKVSMSPWVDEELGAAEIRGDYVFSRKPNPALLAWPQFNAQAVREHLQASVDACARHGCPLELILKDISTVKYEPQRLFEWARLAMDVAGA
jgi:hypothetical protein